MEHTYAWQATNYAERLAAIQAHLRAGGKIMTVTYAKGTIYTKKHLDWFTANSVGLYVRRGRGKDCLNFTAIRFSKE